MKRGASDLLGLQLGEDALGDVEVGHDHGLAGGAEQRLDRAHPLGPGAQTLGDGARLGGGIGRGVSEQGGEAALEDGLRSLAEALELLGELLEKF